MCDDCGWEQLLDDIEEMDEERYSFAVHTVDGIREWVEEKEHCTPSQKRAVENIIRSREE